jgi:hypothetical protein
MSHHTLKRLLSESIDGETVTAHAEGIVKTALGHPLNFRIVREFDLSRERLGGLTPGKGRLSRRYNEIVKIISDELECSATAQRVYVEGFPQVTLHHSLSPDLAVGLCERTVSEHGLTVEQKENRVLNAAFQCGDLWLPVISHPRGNETHIKWSNVSSRYSLARTLRDALAGLRNESKDTPVCKSLECYSVGCELKILAPPGAVILTCSGELESLGSVLKRTSADYLYP